MLELVAENIGTIAVAAVVALIIGLAVVKLVRGKKKGGCPGCGSCGCSDDCDGKPRE